VTLPSLFYVQFRIDDTIHRQGPWPAHEASYHLRDIAGYEGIYDAVLVPAREPAPDAASVPDTAPTAWERVLKDDD
jgi:hypothetical protein